MMEERAGRGRERERLMLSREVADFCFFMGGARVGRKRISWGLEWKNGIFRRFVKFFDDLWFLF